MQAFFFLNLSEQQFFFDFNATTVEQECNKHMWQVFTQVA
jgi:hypothetical protein